MKRYIRSESGLSNLYGKRETKNLTFVEEKKDCLSCPLSSIFEDSGGNVYELPIDRRKQKHYQYAYDLHIGDEVKVSGYFIPQAVYRHGKLLTENCYLIKYPRISGRSMY